MAKYLAGVLSVMAVGVTLIAYSLVGRSVAFAPEVDAYGRPALSAPAVPMGYDNAPAAYPARPIPVGIATAAPAIGYETAPVRPARRAPVVRRPSRDWTKTALVIGGTSAAGAGVGALIGGKKGALIGAAIGGGASALFETRRPPVND